LADRQLLSWQDVHSWTCNACGLCCRGYRVPLRIDEYAKIAGQFGYDTMEFDLGKIYIRRGANDRCVFQRFWQGKWLCTLQAIKPLACKLYPFRISREPRGSGGEDGHYRYRNSELFIYLDPRCPGIRTGTPAREFAEKVLPEIAEIGLGLRVRQYYSTDYKVPLPVFRI